MRAPMTQAGIAHRIMSITLSLVKPNLGALRMQNQRPASMPAASSTPYQ